MRKFLMTILILAMVVCGAVGVAACDKDKPDESQNQGQVEDKDKNDKDKNDKEETPGSGETEKPGTGSETTPGGSTDEGKDDEGNKGETNPPKTPEEEKPGQQTPPETKPENPSTGDEEKDEEKEDEKGEEQTPQNPQNPSNPDDDEPQGDDPSAGGSTEPGEPTDPDKDNPGTGGETTEPGKDDPKPDTPKEDCEHVLTYTVVGTDRNTRQHIGKCSLCGKTFPAEKCTFGEPTTVAATCFDNGYDSYICSVCKVEYRAYGFVPGRGYKDPMKAHNLPATWTHVEGTDYKKSQHERKCLNEGCNYVEVQDCEFDGELTLPTCGQAGKNDRKCKECGCAEKLLTSLEPLEHTWAYRPSDDGEHHEKYCTRPCCEGKECTLEDCKFEETGRTVGTSCTDGTTVNYKCNVCNATKTEVLPGSVGHQYTKTNFCDKCGQDGLKCEYGKMGGLSIYKIVYNDDLKNVKRIVIGDNVKNLSNGGTSSYGIDSGAFKGFSQLVEIYIPSTVVTIYKNAFENTALEKIFYGGTEQNWNRVSPDGSVRGGTVKDVFKKPSGEAVDMEYSQNAETLKERWTKDSSAAATVAALPAEGKRIYD